VVDLAGGHSEDADCEAGVAGSRVGDPIELVVGDDVLVEPPFRASTQEEVLNVLSVCCSPLLTGPRRIEGTSPRLLHPTIERARKYSYLERCSRLTGDCGRRLFAFLPGPPEIQEVREPGGTLAEALAGFGAGLSLRGVVCHTRLYDPEPNIPMVSCKRRMTRKGPTRITAAARSPGESETAMN
jgi:hypothetical protein